MKMAFFSSKSAACLIGLCFGGIGLFAYAPYDQWWISLLSASALIWLATRPYRSAATVGVLAWAISYFALGVNWVHVSMIQFGGVPEIVSYLAVLLLAAYLALYPLLFSYLTHKFRLHNVWAIAGVWTGTEYLRGVVFTGFPWLQFGYSLIDSPFSGVAPVFGVEGLTFFTMVMSGYLVQFIDRFVKKSLQWTACLAPIALLSVAIALQLIVWVNPKAEQNAPVVSLIQGNIAQKMKWDPAHFDETLRTYFSLIRDVMGKSEVIILPESAIPATEGQITPLLSELDQAARQAGSELIIGTLYQAPHGIFNSAIVLGEANRPYSSEQTQRFNKHHLVPFGEYVPFGNLLDWMREIFILPINLSQGAFIQAPLTAANQRFNLAICYEIIFGHQLQQNQKASSADYLLTLSNDAWFGESIGPWQHFQMARMRALELGKPLIRATNTGVTAFVDAYGRVEKQAAQFTATVLSHQLTAYQGQTPFAQIGQWGIYLLSAVSVLMSLLVRKRQE